MAHELTQGVVENWIRVVEGRFHIGELRGDLDIQTPEGRQHLRVILSRIQGKNEILNLGGGWYRKIDAELQIIDWQSADPKAFMPLKFPFDIQKYAKIFPKSIIIVAGSKNAGKTAWLYNFIALNMGFFEIDLFNSETGREQMKERFNNFSIPNDAPFKVYERYDNFADVIDPDKISVIDYLDLNSEVYLVGEEIDRIFRKLKAGVAIVALQKPPPAVTFVKGVKKVFDRDLAYGGGFTAKRAALYISLSASRLKLVYVKTPRSPTVNPDNMQWSFIFDDTGSQFLDITQCWETEGDKLL